MSKDLYSVTVSNGSRVRLAGAESDSDVMYLAIHDSYDRTFALAQMTGQEFAEFAAAVAKESQRRALEVFKAECTRVGAKYRNLFSNFREDLTEAVRVAKVEAKKF